MAIDCISAFVFVSHRVLLGPAQISLLCRFVLMCQGTLVRSLVELFARGTCSRRFLCGPRSFPPHVCHPLSRGSTQITHRKSDASLPTSCVTFLAFRRSPEKCCLEFGDKFREEEFLSLLTFFELKNNFGWILKRKKRHWREEEGEGGVKSESRTNQQCEAALVLLLFWFGQHQALEVVQNGSCSWTNAGALSE